MANFDWANGIEIFKALTPYILAVIVYLVWHKQKEKEVIALEAKNIIVKINELVNESGNLISEINKFKYNIDISKMERIL